MCIISEQGENIVYNMKWMQVFFYCIIVGLPFTACYFFYLAVDLYFKFGITNATVMTLFALIVSYLSYQAFLLMKFVDAKLEFDDHGFKVIFRNGVSAYQWTDIAKAQSSINTQYLRLYDSSGKTIYIVDFMSPGYSEFAEKVNKAVDNLYGL